MVAKNAKFAAKEQSSGKNNNNKLLGLGLFKKARSFPAMTKKSIKKNTFAMKWGLEVFFFKKCFFKPFRIAS